MQGSLLIYDMEKSILRGDMIKVYKYLLQSINTFKVTIKMKDRIIKPEKMAGRGSMR